MVQDQRGVKLPAPRCCGRAMRRLYTRPNQQYQGAGWTCPRCKRTFLDQIKETR
jgi:transposase-like protein